MELLNHDDGTWSLRKITELEHLMLNRIVDAADPSDCDAAARRLHPSPIAPGASVAPDELASAEADWEEYIEPDLRAAFRGSLDVVGSDVATATQSTKGGNVLYEIEVPKAHAEDWCSALNQARLVIHCRYDLPDEDGEMGRDSDPETWMAMLQSEIYGIVMEFLVTSVLWLK